MHPDGPGVWLVRGRGLGLTAGDVLILGNSFRLNMEHRAGVWCFLHTPPLPSMLVSTDPECFSSSVTWMHPAPG